MKNKSEKEQKPAEPTNLLDVVGEPIRHRHGLHVQPIELVGRLGQTDAVRLLGDGLAVGHDRVGDLDGDAGVILLEVLEADLQVELPSAGDDVLTRLLDGTLQRGAEGVILGIFYKCKDFFDDNA